MKQQFDTEKKITGLRFSKREGIWKGTHCTFDGETGWSYRWYCVVVVLPSGKIVFNSEKYSSMTARDISRLHALVGYNCVHVAAPRGLQDADATKERYEYEIKKLNKELNATGKHKVRDRDSRINRLKEIEKELETAKELKKFFNRKK